MPAFPRRAAARPQSPVPPSSPPPGTPSGQDSGAPRRRRHARPVRRLRPVPVLAVLLPVVLTAATVTVVRSSAEGEALAADPVVPAVVAAPASPSATPAVDPSPSPSGPPPPVLRLAGGPSTGAGTFGYDPRAGAVLGRAGTVQRYRVAVENGSGEDVRAFSDQVQTALTGPGSWVDSGALRLRRVPGNAPAEFTVYLATASTAGRMCLAGGVDIRSGGRPYTSCRAPGKVIINLDRWRTSVAHFVRAGVPLSLYRLYVVNHEVGHQLGHHHEACPGAGRPAPVMQQQTLFLDGCRPNPWPYLNGKRYTGPAL